MAIAPIAVGGGVCVCVCGFIGKEGNILTTHSTHFIYDYMVSDII